MDTATPTQVADHPVKVGASVRRSRRRRRPSGAPPPLPRHLETTGVGWLLATVGLVTVFAVSFVASRRGAAVAVTAADDRVVRWLAELRGGWLTSVLPVAAFPDNWLAYKILAWCIVVPQLVFRRFRHLVVYVVALAVISQLSLVLSTVLKRPRPFGVVIEGAGTAMRCRPSRSQCLPRAWSAPSTCWCRRAAGDRPESGRRPSSSPWWAWPG